MTDTHREPVTPGKLDPEDFPPLLPKGSPEGSPRNVPAGQRAASHGAGDTRPAGGSNPIGRALSRLTGGRLRKCLGIDLVMAFGCGTLAAVGAPLMWGLIGNAVRLSGAKTLSTVWTVKGVAQLARRNWANIKDLAIGTLSPWGSVATVDALIGITFINLWVAYREMNAAKALVIALINSTFGNATGCLYIGYALMQSKGDWRVFWMGDRNAVVRPPSGKKLE